MILVPVQALAGRRVEDPTAAEIGEPRDLRNFVADSGARDYFQLQTSLTMATRLASNGTP